MDDDKDDEQQENSIDFISDISIYDTISPEEEQAGEESAKSAKKEKIGFINYFLQQIDAMPDKLIYTLIVLLIVLIIVLISAALIMRAYLNEKDYYANESGYHITIPLNTLNNANFIFTPHDMELKGQMVKLQKLLIDSVSTGFYFNQHFDTSGLNIKLIDADGNEYQRDLTYIDEVGKSHNTPVVLRFEALKHGTRIFTLFIEGEADEEDIEVKFVTDKPWSAPVARYVIEAMDIYPMSEGISARIDNAVFSTMESKMNFIFEWEDESRRLSLGFGDTLAKLTLEENLRNVFSAQTTPSIYTFDNCIIGSMTYEPLRSLGSDTDFVFRNLYEEVDLDMDISGTSLFFNKEDEYDIYNLGMYSLVLERFGWQGDYYILVLHGYKNDDESRVETQLSAELAITKADGTELVIPGVCRYGAVGTDMRFNISDVKDELLSLPQDNFTLHLRTAAFRLDDAKVNIKPGDGRTSNDAEREAVLAMVVESFEKRLAYKSSEIAKQELTGFASGVLNNRGVMRQYNPQALSESAYKNAQVLTYSISGEFMYAIVQELWRGRLESGEVSMNLKHKIILRNTNNKWLIISDEIIE